VLIQTNGATIQCDLGPLAIMGFADSLFSSQVGRLEQVVLTMPIQAVLTRPKQAYSGVATSDGCTADPLLPTLLATTVLVV